MPWEELGKSKVSIDQSNPGISNGVALTGSNILVSIDEKSTSDGVPANEALAVSRYVSIVNYGPGDLKVNIDAPTTEPGAFTVRAGDSRQVDCRCTTLHWLSTGDTVFTAVGV